MPPTKPKSQPISEPVAPPVPTSASSWGRAPQAEDGFVVELPSGNFAKVRRSLDMLDLLRSGKIPNPLAAVVQEMMDGKATALSSPEMQSREGLEQLMDMLDTYTVRTMIEPAVSRPIQSKDFKASDFSDLVTDEIVAEVDAIEDEDMRAERLHGLVYLAYLRQWTPDDNTLSIFDIELNDKMFLFGISQGAVADAKSFRDESTRAMASLPASRPVPKPTKRTGGGKRGQK